MPISKINFNNTIFTQYGPVKKPNKFKDTVQDNKKLIGYGLCSAFVVAAGIISGRAISKHIKFQKAQKAYNDLFAQVSLNGSGFGLNRVMGHSQLKTDIVDEFFTSMGLKVLKGDKELVKVNALPNGLVIFGEHGTGKKYIMDAVGEHAEKLGMKFVKPEIIDGDITASAKNIRDAFQQANQDFNNDGKYTFILMNKMDTYCKDRILTKDNLLEVNNLLKLTENSSQRGALWLGIADDIKVVDRALLDRATMISPIRPMDNMELCDTLKYHLSKEKDLNLGQIDYNKLLAKLNESENRYSPKQMAEMAQEAISGSKSSNEPITTESLLNMFENKKTYAIDDAVVKHFNEDLEYARNEGFIPPKYPDFDL